MSITGENSWKMLKKANTMPGKLLKALRSPRIIYNVLVAWYLPLHNRFYRRLPLPPECALPALNEIYQHTLQDTDISDHLPALFAAALRTCPRMMVELGVRGGQSTFVLQRVAQLCGCPLISIDMDDCSQVSDWKEWRFVQSDDVAFAQRFQEYCLSEGLKHSDLDFLFLDTSHLYDHTVAELKAWMPLLSSKAVLVLHDSNQRHTIKREDGRRMLGLENRGVTSALETVLHCTLQETRDYTAVQQGWLITHRAVSNGLTILERIPCLPAV